MKNRVLFRIPLLIGSLFLPLGCGTPTGLQPSESCSGQPDDAIVTFGDANLEAAVVRELRVGGPGDLTCDLVSKMRGLLASDAGITSLVGIQNLTSLTVLYLSNRWPSSRSNR